MKPTKPLFFLFFCILNFYLAAQERPPIEVYTPTDYNAENQNWSISQSDNKYIYIANNKGLLEFNGAKWTLHSNIKQTTVRSVNVINNHVYTGSYREFGYWEPNIYGLLKYTSLSDKLNIPFLDDEEIWNIITIDDWILFQSLNRIYIYNTQNQEYSIIESETTIYKIFKVNKSIYFQKVKDGVYEIENGKSKLVSNDPILQENLLVNIFYHNNNILFETEDSGFYHFKDNTIKKWQIQANEALSKVRIYSSKQLKDKSFLLGTVSNGIIHLTSNGEINYQIDQTNGLSNNTVLSVFEDLENNIWLGLENGINCINIKSPFSIYKDQKGNIGSVNTSTSFNGYLYLGTNQGLFYKKLDANSSKFELIEGTQGAVWCLTAIDNTLFCGHNSGTFIINGTKANLVIDVLGTWGIKKIDGRTDLLLQGNYNGLNLIEKTNGTWKLKNKIKGFDISSRYFEILNSTEVLVSHEYKGVFHVKLDANLSSAVNVKQDVSVSKGPKSCLIKYENDILYSYGEGVFKYNKAEQKFIKDSIYSQLLNKETYTSGKLVSDAQSNKLWSFSKYNISYIAPRKLSDIPKINTISLPINLRNDVAGYENMTYINDNLYLYGTSQGYILIDLAKMVDTNFKISINSILTSTYNNGYKFNLINKNDKGDYKNNENNIQFEFSIPEYKKYIVAEYQFKLDGIYNEWSTWSTNSNALFENLPYGNYTFHVRGRLGNQFSDNTETYSFMIERPWYISNIAITGYVLFILFFSLLMHNIYKRYYKKQREKLLEKTQQKLELKELENKQQFMRFNNDKLRQDIENKNRELGISTMSLIKKNEFLNSIKKELQKAQEDKSLKQVIKIIDRNLNNTDDWQAFEEAFNNADKDFIKKIKSIHPVLTSNDLRLCAYLRLNLSSKEIAPLLNISARSVEVKRYRLRKKMNLEHDDSLTDYILEI
ncbi:triple tyrosine motif-containing protein [Mariniflexile sp. AS56]|uniref:helix-turn-helix and ligand-binding sensor domain-containing protein n=1 Tax=Mariniflexile sp. AS56 TaxID=3063957 RepID=UPI0026F2B2F1|nr:triple tyrosine motif-containing protein [Mariniflexile sp. AS56]MDO7171545.1 triple tyrosine motif-containing protein [Mariniflexile sp. AS56]